MNCYVIDASVAIKFYVPEPLSNKAVGYLEQYRHNEAILLAPHLLIAEMGNVLWKKVQINEISGEDAIVIADLLGQHCPFKLIAERDLLPAAIELAMSLELTVYDSLYLALAISAEANLVTADKKIKEVTGSSPFSGQVILLN